MLDIIERKLKPTDNNEFILSDGEPDRMGDVIEPDGWQIGSFNPIALFNHNRSDIIGKWERVRVEAKALRGSLRLAEPGTSPVVDMARALFDQGLLDTVSVGFRALDREPIDPKDAYGPQRFKRAELIEASLVSIPANPRARRIAKQFLPEDQYRRLCVQPGADDGEPKPAAITRAQPGKPAELKPVLTKATNMEGLSPLPIGKKIEVTEAALVSLKDQLSDIGVKLASADEATDEQQVQVEALTAEINAKEKALATLKNVEAGLKTKAVQIAPKSSVVFPAFERKALSRADYLFKAMTAGVIAHLWKSHGKLVSPDQIIKERYNDDEAMQLILKAVTVPGTTVTSGWAQELVGQLIVDFVNAFPVNSIYPGLSAMGARFTFGRNGTIKIPIRNYISTIGAAGMLNGSFVGEGSAIPVRRASLTSISLTPKKMAVISTFTKELDLHSTPSIETVIRQAVNEDTSRAIDAALVSSTAADTIQPAGLLAAANGPIAISTASSATTSYDKMVADLKTMIGNIVAGGGGQALALLINPADALSLSWATLPDGSFPFDAGAVNGGVLRGIKVFQSPQVTAKRPIMLDAAEFVSVTGDSPEFDVSDQATLHEDDAPAAIIAPTTPPGTGPAVPSFPVRSLWQTYSAAIRMILPMNWAMRRTAMVTNFTTNVGW